MAISVCVHKPPIGRQAERHICPCVEGGSRVCSTDVNQDWRPLEAASGSEHCRIVC